ncbi:bifunctional diaminohydroxyphosphoribosylaminopyrimidine deaminase/5-amino-6-(5-phosphoribosylamino)uracil reductase RibD [Halomonas garicola]|uniref:bifunctional diaminohydroxyphosphoribosylaminopyrimidine deaminase/5-amino-6-(5-phosphoribosylamino)uracil reductase RibD n=1 Tax=Halomonas garicola TaxID=1690008 RepID=UPI0028A02BF8|nr:bifunctional diaminohydroxyphosphoribosylaminopyrimidine deaminase/5-amino-6-(5-phosphoribosylamino)uracil reductase RibD [Halomonas garicola]
MVHFSAADHRYMARALRLAERGRYTADPNPRVGCVIVGEDNAASTVVGEGFHRRAGEAHAEVNALAAAGERARGATAYVTLEPCSHTGRTGPCAKALVDAGIARVVIAMEDPNPRVSGRGVALLQSAGAVVETGLLVDDARQLNPGFIARMETGRPLVRLKMAMSLDGRTAMASGESQWITGPEARAEVQRLRARSSAVLSGVASVLMDNSRLTVRAAQLGLESADEVARRQPLRIIVDSRLRLPPTAACLAEPGRTLIATVPGHGAEKRTALEAAGAEIVTFDAGADGRVNLAALVAHLAEAEAVNELLVETGATLAGAMLDAGLVDSLWLFMAPTLLGADARGAFALPGLERMADQRRLRIDDVRAVGPDWRIIASPLPAGAPGDTKVP